MKTCELLPLSPMLWGKALFGVSNSPVPAAQPYARLGANTGDRHGSRWVCGPLDGASVWVAFPNADIAAPLVQELVCQCGAGSVRLDAIGIRSTAFVSK